jgi:Flp pilus assembly protein TadB
MVPAWRRSVVSSTGGPDDRDPVLITEAEPSLDAQLAARQRKYGIMMAVRALCLVLAAVFYQTWWLLAIFVLGAVVLPWMAVLIANDRPPKKAQKINRYGGHPDPGRAIAAPPGEGRVIEG